MTYLQTHYDPFTTVGFDRIFDRMATMHQTAKASPYPPYNITKESDVTYIVEMAVAGFSEDMVDISVKEGVLTVEGKISDTDKKEYIHKGIAARAFTKTFTLADTIVVREASLRDGMLRILLENVIPEEKKPQKIAINGPTVDTKQLLTE
jgi:molecular chaperone IbpA|tara:strand:- start:174 stop:623 length:450 start_codon:yes stop_codon:yes gene_type:complete